MFSTLGKIRTIKTQLLWIRRSGSCCTQSKYAFVIDTMGQNVTIKDL